MTRASLSLAVDVGASRTAAALARTEPDGVVTVQPFPLGRHGDSAPSLVFVGDGELLFGDAAERRGLAQPERLVRDVKRRVGDATPLLVGDRRFTPEQLFAHIVTWVGDAVVEREGRRPASLIVTVPASWGVHRRGLVTRALEREGWRHPLVVSEPEAAARHYAATRALDPGALAVYDLGGGTFDAALVRIDAEGAPELLADPVGLEAFGGSDFDDAVLAHALRAAGLSASDLALDDDARIGLAALRRESVEAKEALSFDAEAVIPVLVADGRPTVRLTRSEFEGMIEEGIGRTVDRLSGLLESAGVDAADLTAILLTGGSSRIPRIAQLLSERFDRPVAVDADPKAVIALGAARSAAVAPSAAGTAPEADEPTPVEPSAEPAREDAVVVRAPASAPQFDRPERRPAWLGRAATIAAVSVGALVLCAGVALSVLSPGAAAPAPAPGDRATTSPTPAAPSAQPSAAPATEPSTEPTTDAPEASPLPLLTPAPSGAVTDVFPPAGGTPTPHRTPR